MAFEHTLTVGWAQIDFNQHLRNSAYLDMCSDVRMQFFESHGFSAKRFAERQFGPVVRRDSVEYFREVSLLVPLRVTLRLAGLSEDGSRWRLRNDFYRPDGVLSATVVSVGSWLDLAARKLLVPPPEVHAALAELERSDDYETMSPVRRD